MKQYIGTKIVKAWPEWKHYGADGNVHYVSHEPALLVGESAEAGYGVLYEDGYKSWSPMTAFEKAYRETTGMPFGLAIEAAKKGKRIARAGWNGKNQYVELATCISYVRNDGGIINAHHDAIGNKALAFVGTSGVQMGWLASQADMLADDWMIVE